MKIHIPTNCPTCQYQLELVNQQLFCRNSSCEAQLYKKLAHMTKVLGIKGFGPKTIEKLQLNDLTELFYLDQSLLAGLLGEKTAIKLLDEIEKAKQSPLNVVLNSMSIPLIGAVTSTKIASVVSHIDEITPEKCSEAGLGSKETDNLLDWLATDFQEMREFLPFSFSSEMQPSSNANAKTICITGKLNSFKTKAEAKTKLESLGFTVVESVTKATDFLVDEENKLSTKRKKAESLGITIITNLTEFINSKDI